MFTEAERSDLRAELVAAAQADPRITAAALVGSAARDGEDRWSDVDLALGLAPGLQPRDAVDGWTDRMYTSHGATADLDVWAHGALYRVFLLRSTLQVDLSFWPAEEFAPRGGPFRLLFGEARPAVPTAPRDTTGSIGMAWLYALHARSSIARGRALQGLHMLDGMRDQVVVLACVRRGLPADQGRGVDDLEEPVRRRLGETLVRSLEPAELARAFGRLTDVFLDETGSVDATTALALAPVLRELVLSVTAHRD